MTKKKVKAVADMTETPEPEVMLKVKDAAKILNCSGVTINRLLNSGQVPHVRVGKVQRIPRSSFMRFISEKTRNGHNDNHVD